MLLYVSSRFFIDEKGMSGKSILNTFVSTARCSSSRNSLRGITHSPSPHVGGGATSSFDGIFCVKNFYRSIISKCVEIVRDEAQL